MAESAIGAQTRLVAQSCQVRASLGKKRFRLYEFDTRWESYAHGPMLVH